MTDPHVRTHPLLPPRPRALADLVAYQEGAVVSRTLMDGAGGSVTLFAFAAGEGLREHTSPYDALVYLVEGEAEVVIAGASHRVRGGEVILLPAHEPHALRAVQPFKMLLVMVRAAR